MKEFVIALSLIAFVLFIGYELSKIAELGTQQINKALKVRT